MAAGAAVGSIWVDTPVAAAFVNLATMLLQRSVLAPSRARVRELDDSDPLRATTIYAN